MNFEQAWTDLKIDDLVRVSDGNPPPSNTTGTAYNAWRSHNFVGTLEEKIERNGWRYLKFEVLPSDVPENVVYLAYEVADGPNHTFVIQE